MTKFHLLSQPIWDCCQEERIGEIPDWLLTQLDTGVSRALGRDRT
jgi:hypothetical protein